MRRHFVRRACDAHARTHLRSIDWTGTRTRHCVFDCMCIDRSSIILCACVLLVETSLIHGLAELVRTPVGKYWGIKAVVSVKTSRFAPEVAFDLTAIPFVVQLSVVTSFTRSIADSELVKMAKRKLEFADYEEIDVIEEEIGNATIHGVVTHVSPVKVSKKGHNYFHGEVSDGRSALRFIGFVPRQQQQLKAFQQTRRSVQLNNIQVKPSQRDTGKKEILVKGSTKICASRQEFGTSAMDFRYTSDKRLLKHLKHFR